MATIEALEEARKEVISGVIESWTTVVKVGLMTEGDLAMGVEALIIMMSVRWAILITREVWKAGACSFQTWHLRPNGSI